MSDGRKIVPNQGSFFQSIAIHVGLVWRLMLDRRVNPLLKLLPIGSLLYLLFPIDLPGPIDDAAVIWMSSYLFIEMCPPEVVEEYRAELNKVVPGVAQDAPTEIKDEDVVDAQYKEE